MCDILNTDNVLLLVNIISGNFESLDRPATEPYFATYFVYPKKWTKKNTIHDLSQRNMLPIDVMSCLLSNGKAKKKDLEALAAHK